MAQLADPRQAAYTNPNLDLLDGPFSTLPPFAEVKEQVALLSRLRRSQQVPSTEECKRLFAKLLRFCLLVEVFDVPDYMLEDIAFISEMFIRAAYEGPQGIWADGVPGKRGRLYETTLELRMKRIVWLIMEPVNRPLEALEEVELHIKEFDQVLEHDDSPYCDTPWVPGLYIYSRYGDVLVLANKFGPDTHTVLQNILVACCYPCNIAAPSADSTRATAHMHLALLGQISGDKGDEHKRHVEAAARYFRKHRTGTLHASNLYLQRPDQPIHPVYVALGEEWFTNRPSKKDDKHPGKFCTYCDKPEMQTTLLQCARCKWVYYCSKECQKGDWKAHKDTCKTYTEDQQVVEQVRKSLGPQVAIRVADYNRWCYSSHYTNSEALIHALGLRQDPNRGHTHIVVREVECVSGPRPADFRDRIRVTKCSVFKMKDVAGDLAKIVGSSKTPKAYYESMQRMVEEVSQEGGDGKPLPGAPPLPFRRLALMYFTFLRGGVFSTSSLQTNHVPEHYVRALKYEPDWREFVNGSGPPPMPFVLPNGPQDAEHIF
ncbi:hypothetical protein EIP91_008708 [Steccherinum ochraceum]|uniref:MYND-type domain-containing protein n=1 Tax=Steccherinum ochraceum TaxID=92696 RepID=A0A4R0RAM9_9APHY|nr:hypothetical protein EIP91_008708 [Steccherinum ochraceum]